MRVIGVGDSAPSERLSVFIQVENPTRNDLQLSRLQYDIDAGQWFAGTGEVEIARAIAPRGTAVVELKVPLRGPIASDAVRYTLRGKLFATDERIERFWNVKASGALSPRTGRAEPIKIRVAHTD